METKDIISLLHQPELAALAHESVRDYIDWEQLTTRPLPPGMSIAEVWELLGQVRYLGRNDFPIGTIDGIQFWYGMTRDGERCLQFIRRYCREDSDLHRLLQEREGHRFLVRSRIQEAIATCQLDGVLIDYERAGKMLQEGRAPHTPVGRLVANSYEMLRELESLAPEPFTPELVRALYERITHGVDVAALPRGRRFTNLAGVENPDDMRQKAEERGILQQICDYANLKTGEPLEPTAVKAYMIMSAMAYWHPLPDLNDTVARHMMRLFAVKQQYPVLGYLSTSLQMLRWFQGELAPGVTRFATIQRRRTVPGTTDGTPDILTHLQLTSSAVQELLGYIEVTQSEQDALHDALDSAEDLNYRQRTVLARALAHPGAEFQIRQHQMSHRVVYQTARTDLLDLEERGFLRKEQRGKAFVFVPAEDLQERLRGVE